MAAASVHVMQLPKATYDQHTSPMQSHINVGSGSDVTIAEVAQAIAQAVGYTGQVEFDTSKPDGAPRKWMDSSRLRVLGWQAKVDLCQGLAFAYEDFASVVANRY
jgi:GDP-L-fucose synthase